MTAAKTTDDLANEAIELIRKKNIKFSVKTAGHKWACTVSPRDEYEKSRSSSFNSTSSASSSGSSTPEPVSASSVIRRSH